MPKDITFYEGVQSGYDKLPIKDANGIYFISDTKSIYKGEVKYGGGDIATPSSAGIVKPSGDFDITSDGTISLYKPMAINSFSHNAGIQELGASLSSTTFSWGLNKNPSELSLTGGPQTSTLNKTQNGSVEVRFTAPLKATTTFTLTAKDSRGVQGISDGTTTHQTSIQFLNGKYYGVSNVNSADAINDAFVKGLTKNLVTGRTGSFTVNAAAGQYIYFAIPSFFGVPVFNVGGFDGGFNKIKTFNFTNASGHAENYDVYKSTNAGLGSTTVVVK